MLLFDALVAIHIVSGSIGLITLWVPIYGKKGSVVHKRWGRIFANSLLFTGFIAIGISCTTLLWPLETHPFSDDAALIRGLFGWMMLYLAILTIMLAYYGRSCIKHRAKHHLNRHFLNLFLQAITFASAINCFAQGYRLGQVLMMGIAIVGIAAAVLNTRFIFTKAPPRNEWLIQHSRGMVGAGISVYTAFLAFGAVNLLPEIALNPLLWALPTSLGISYLLYHQYGIAVQRQHSPTASAKTNPEHEKLESSVDK